MNELEIMLDAYRQLYEIENHLRLIIKTNMQKKYGRRWSIVLNEKRSEQNSYYHELVALFGKYPHLLPHFTEEQRKQLYRVTPIRDKIAHSHLINEEEYKYLKVCHQMVMKQPLIKRAKGTDNYILQGKAVHN